MKLDALRFIILGALLCLTRTAPADTFTPLDFPGASATEPSGITATGLIVGAYTDGTGVMHGFKLDDDGYATIDYPGALRTAAVAGNASGDIAGFFLDSSSQWHGFVLSNGAYAIQDHPAATTGSFTLGISANGALVGEFKVGQVFGQLGFSWILRHGQYTELTPPDAVRSFATSVNARGDVVGRLIDATGDQLAWKLDRQGTYAVFQFPGAALSNARGINDRGEIVGVYLLAGVNHGFVLPPDDVTHFTTIDYPGASSTRALGINPQGEIVGTYDIAGVRHGYLLRRDPH
jgi:uncharacterized membrane protein